MNICKLTGWAGIAMLISLAACTNVQEKDTEDTDISTDVPPTNGEETRYNLNSADTMVTPIDSNRVDTSDLQ